MRISFLSSLSLCLPLVLGSTALASDIAASDGVSSIGHLPCTARQGENMSDCAFEVMHKEDGAFTLRVLLPGGSGAVRYIYGKDGAITGTDSTGSLASKRLDKTTVVQIRPEEVFEIDNSLLTAK